MENGRDETNRNGKGRPSKSEQLEIERNLRTYFGRGKSTYQAAIKTGYSINTVKKYFSNFYKEVRDSEGPEFVQACKDRIVSACLAIDVQLSKMEEMQKELDQIPQAGTRYIQLYKLKISLANSISDLFIKKLNIANSPTFDEMLVAIRKLDEDK